QTGGEAGGLGAAAGPSIPPGEGGPVGAAGTGTTPGAPPGAVPGGQVGQAPIPTTVCGAVGAATCAPCAYSATLNLCFDANTGYVWNEQQRTWQQPPVTAACSPYVFWPKLAPNGACYDPATGYAYNPGTCPGNPQACWVYVGANYEVDTGSDEGGCSVVTTSKTGSATLLGLLGLVTGAGVVARRRRVRRA
ncbi:MAG: hypothetical protein ABW217_00635, partial [Polyangiaceae bacterium]